MSGGAISRAKRYTALRLLQSANTLLVHVNHQLWRVAHNAEACDQAFTPKELDYLRKRLAVSEQVREDLTKLTTRMQKGF